VTDPALGHPASHARPWRPAAPVPIPVIVAVDGFLLLFAGLIAVTEIPWLSFVPALVVGAAVLIVHGRMAAKELGIRSRNETPQAWLTALALPGGVVGVLAAHLGRYGPLVVIAYLAFGHVAERLVWMRFDASRRATKQG
jgi:uncharacterized membrane protein HdeD (DUF308 family)